MNRTGSEALWDWFGVGRASWLTMPRSLMHGMPDEWQARMADLLRQYDDFYPNQPEVGTRVLLTDMSGKLIKTPDEVLNYRHPSNFVERCRAED